MITLRKILRHCTLWYGTLCIVPLVWEVQYSADLHMTALQEEQDGSSGIRACTATVSTATALH